LVSDGDSDTIGYYTLAATSVALADLPEPLAKRLLRYPVVRATLMGRLVVDARHRREGHGEFFDAFSRVLRNDIASYALWSMPRTTKQRSFVSATDSDFSPKEAGDCLSRWPRSLNCSHSIRR
jgi:hypothetical protein